MLNYNYMRFSNNAKGDDVPKSNLFGNSRFNQYDKGKNQII